MLEMWSKSMARLDNDAPVPVRSTRGAPLLALIGLARILWPEDLNDVKIPADTEISNASAYSDRDILLLRQAFPRCRENLTKFLDAKTASERAELSFSPDQAITHMAYFEVFSPMAKINPQAITHLESAVLELPIGLAIESHWKSEKGHIFSTVFIESGNDWRLDWEHFARFSDGSWPLFLAGSGPPEGTFRLLARERLTDERETTVIRMTLYAASSENSHQTGNPSPEFTVPRDTRNGRLLDAAFKLARSNKLPFGVKLPLIDPEGLIRVRVKIRRVQESDSRRFELVSVIACHWYSTVEPGVEIVD